MTNPRFNRALGASLLTAQAKPPMRFEGVTARVFPLPANMNRLSKFCDSYLGVAPDVARFRPAMPYVFLMALDYGKMSAEFENFGWVSQREVAFAVPLEWYDTREDPENPAFVDFAAVCPFIYVDDEMSLSTGRKVYGWPKVKVWASGEVNPWIYDPVAAQRLLSLSTMVYPELYAGERQEPRILLEVCRDPIDPFASFPPRPAHPSSPFSLLPQAISAYQGLFTTFIEMMTRAPQLGYETGTPMAPWLGMLRAGRAGLSALSRNPSLNNVTLKQFRDAQEPWRICYQALVNSQIRVTRYNAFGMLGNSNQLLGDPSGGFRVIMRRYDAQPVVDSLGIDVAQEIPVEGASTDVLRPLFPFWMDVDLEYGAGEHLCWRTKGSPWYCGNPSETHRERATRPSQPPAGQVEPETRFNTTLGGALQGVTGPFAFPNTTLRVLPLLADRRKLREFCSEYLKDDCSDLDFDFEPWGSYVYLVATNYEDMSSETNNIGWWADRELSFLVPVICKRDGKLVSVGMVPTFSFANTSTAAISASEIKGQPTARAQLSSPPNAWMNEAGASPDADQVLLACRTQIMPALFLGQEAELADLLEIRRADPPLGGHWRTVADRWGPILKAEHERLVEQKWAGPRDKQASSEIYQRAKALALELLAHRQPWNFISLKQFRDAHDPDEACYQSIVRTRRVIEHVDNIEEIEGESDRLHVYIHRQPTQPIVETLGLRVKWTAAGREAPVDILQPLRPFWLRVGLREELGKHLFTRAADTHWTIEPDGSGEPEIAPGFFEDEGRTHVGPGVLEQMLGTEPEQYQLDSARKNRQHLETTAQEWLQRSAKKERLTRQEAADAVALIEPQAVIEGILSAEWGAWVRPRWFRILKRSEEIPIKPDLCVRCDSVGDKPNQDRMFGGTGWYSTDEEPHSLTDSAKEKASDRAPKSRPKGK